MKDVYDLLAKQLKIYSDDIITIFKSSKFYTCEIVSNYFFNKIKKNVIEDFNMDEFKKNHILKIKYSKMLDSLGGSSFFYTLSFYFIYHFIEFVMIIAALDNTELNNFIIMSFKIAFIWSLIFNTINHLIKYFIKKEIKKELKEKTKKIFVLESVDLIKKLLKINSSRLEDNTETLNFFELHPLTETEYKNMKMNKTKLDNFVVNSTYNIEKGIKKNIINPLSFTENKIANYLLKKIKSEKLKNKNINLTNKKISVEEKNNLDLNKKINYLTKSKD